MSRRPDLGGPGTPIAEWVTVGGGGKIGAQGGVTLGPEQSESGADLSHLGI